MCSFTSAAPCIIDDDNDGDGETEGKTQATAGLEPKYVSILMTLRTSIHLPQQSIA